MTRRRSSRCSSTAAGRTPATRSSAPTTRPRSRSCSSSPGAPTRRGLAGRRSSCCSRSRRRTRLRGAKAFDAAALRADFGYVFDHATPIGEVVVASPTYYRLQRRVPRPRRARRRPPRGRPQRDPRRRARAIAAMPHGPHRRRRRPPTSARSTAASASTNVVPERCRLLAEARSLDADRVETGDRRDDRRRPRRRRRRPSATSTSCARSCSTATARRRTAPAVVAAEAALRACGYEPRADRHRRRLGRQRARSRTGFDVRQPRQRHRAQPRADRAGQRRRARGDARRRPGAARRGARRSHELAASSALEARTVFEGAIFDVVRGPLPPRGRRGGHARVGRAPRRGRRSSPTTTSTSGSCASRARRSASPTCSSSPPASSTRRARRRWSARQRELAEEIGKAAEHWEHLHDASTPRPGFTDEQVPRLPRHRPARRARPRDREDERIDDRAAAARRARRADRRGRATRRR